MASGVPLLSTDNQGVHEYATHGVDAWICDHHVDVFTESATWLLDGEPERRRLAEAARARALEFDWKRIGARWALWLKGLWQDDGRWTRCLAEVEERALEVLR